MANISWNERTQGRLREDYLTDLQLRVARLTLRYISNMVIIPNWDTLIYLSCMDSKIKYIPSLKNLEKLSLVWCPNIVSIPPLPSLKVLELEQCKRFKFVPNSYPLLENVVITNCQLVDQLLPIERLPMINNLFCMNLVLSTIPDYPLLTRLDCTNMIYLTKLPKCPRLTILNCNDCLRLDGIDDIYPNLLKLNCSNCFNVERLPSSSTHIKELLCDRTRVMGLPAYPKLISLSCKECINITKILSLPSLEFLDCSQCTILESLPSDSSLVSLVCNECPILSSLPLSYHRLNYLSCDGCINITSIPSTYIDLRFLSCYRSGIMCLPSSLYRLQFNEQLKVELCPGEEMIDDTSDEEEEEEVSSSEDEWEELQHQDEIIDEKEPIDYLRTFSYDQYTQNMLRVDKPTEFSKSIGMYEKVGGYVHNLASSEDEKIEEYLRENPKNMIFMIQVDNGAHYSSYGYTLDQILSDPKVNIAFECAKDHLGRYKRLGDNSGQIVPLEQEPNAFVKISIGLYPCFVPANELLGAIESGERVFLLENPRTAQLTFSYGAALGGRNAYVSDAHCQEGSHKTIYTLRILEQTRLGKRSNEDNDIILPYLKSVLDD